MQLLSNVFPRGKGIWTNWFFFTGNSPRCLQANNFHLRKKMTFLFLVLLNKSFIIMGKQPQWKWCNHAFRTFSVRPNQQRHFNKFRLSSRKVFPPPAFSERKFWAKFLLQKASDLARDSVCRTRTKTCARGALMLSFHPASHPCWLGWQTDK